MNSDFEIKSNDFYNYTNNNNNSNFSTSNSSSNPFNNMGVQANLFALAGSVGETLAFAGRQAQKFNSASLVNLARASLNNQLGEYSPYGYWGQKLDSSVTFLTTAVSATLYAITNLFLTLISLPFALFSNSASNFCKSHAYHTFFDLSAIFIGAVGTVSPNSGQKLFLGLAEKVCEHVFESSLESDEGQEIGGRLKSSMNGVLANAQGLVQQVSTKIITGISDFAAEMQNDM